MMVVKSDQEKMYQLSKNVVMLSSGEDCYAPRFSQYIQRDFQLYTIRNGFNLSPYSVARLTRSKIAHSLRTRVCVEISLASAVEFIPNLPLFVHTMRVQDPILVNMLVAGTDQDSEVPELYWIDYLGTFCKLPYAAHGRVSYFTLSIMDKYWKPDIDLETACSIMKKCISEIQKRFILQQSKFKVRVVDREGTREIEV